MPQDPSTSEYHLVKTVDAVASALSRLHEARAVLSSATGGASPALVLAGFAQDVARDLSEHFDDLPMHRFSGGIPRSRGLMGSLLPAKYEPHRLLLGRYVDVNPPQPDAPVPGRIAVLAVGADGVLRVGEILEAVYLTEEPPSTALSWNDERLRGVPSRGIRLDRWHGGGDAVHVATPGEVLDALAKLASTIAADFVRDLDRVRRLLGAP